MTRTVAGAALLLMLASPAEAFERLRTMGGTPLAWTAGSIPWSIAPDPDPALAAELRAGVDVWAGALGARRPMPYRGRRAADPQDATITVSPEVSWDDAAWGEGRRSVAFTRLRYHATTGEISDADVLLNDRDFEFGPQAGAFDPRSVVAHELGHALGLAHSCGDPDGAHPSCFQVPEAERERVLSAVMAPTLAVGVRRAELAEDDLAALAELSGAGVLPLPAVVRVGRRCPQDRLEIELAAATTARLEARLRFDDGRPDEALGATEGEADRRSLGSGPVRARASAPDLLLVDTEGRYVSQVAAALPSMDCPGFEAEDAGGCRAGPGPSPAVGWTAGLLGVILLARPRRRR